MKKITVTLLLFICLVPAAFAHEKRQVSGYDFVVGFVNEPAFSGEMNGIDFRVSSGGKPVEGLDKTLKATVLSGDQKLLLPLTVKARHKEPGRYAAYFLPSQPVKYIFLIEGEIEGKMVKETFESHEVQDSAKLRFPPISG